MPNQTSCEYDEYYRLIKILVNMMNAILLLLSILLILSIFLARDYSLEERF